MNLISFVSNLLAPMKGDSLYTVYQTINIIFISLMGIAALAAIVLIMIQPGNSRGIDALGGSSETFYGKNKGKSLESKLKLWTAICLIVLGVLAVLFFILQITAIWEG